MNERINSGKFRGWLALGCSLWLAGGPLLMLAQDAPPTNPAAAPAPAAPAAPAAPPQLEDASPTASVESTVAEAVSNATAAVKAARTSHRVHRTSGNPKVIFGNNGEVRAGETNEVLVVIGGNGSVKGRVEDAAVVIGGNLDIEGEVGDAAVVILGNLHVRSNAVVHGEAVAVGGEVQQDEGAIVMGEKQSINLGPLNLPHMKPLVDWFNQCVLKLRPLAPQVGWVWIVAAVVFFFYLLVAVVLPKPVQTCVEELTRRPATTFLIGLLTKLAAPIVTLILLATGIGLILVPFLTAALFFAAIIGKVALLVYFGDSLRRAIGGQEALKPVAALCAGTVLILICYNIPVLGLLVFMLTSVWGLGVAVAVAFSSLKRESPSRPAPVAAAAAPVGQPGYLAPMPVAMAAAPAGENPPANAGPAMGAAPTDTAGATNPNPSAQPAPFAPPTGSVPEALAYPRARFWERMGAAFLDMVLVGILMGMASNLPGALGEPPIIFLVALAYFAGMWTWRGTTVGGVVLNLKVVRLDHQPVTFSVAVVRGLAAAFSTIVFFLGFLWILWDVEKQGWHDRIAGTVVVRLPQGTPLVVF